MKKLVLPIALLLSLFLVAMPVTAQAEKCSLGTVSVVNDVTADGVAHAKTTWAFNCGNSTKDFGQVTKILYNIPLLDVNNFEASDSLGTMKVLEGPAYAAATTNGKQSTLGVIFRKPLLITDSATSYAVSVEFDSSALVGKGENGTFSIVPGSQISNPKTTIVTNGVTETTYQIDKLNYDLNLPSDARITSSPLGCAVKNERLTCKDLSKASFDTLEIKWSKPEGVGGLLDKIKGTFGNLFKGISDRLSQLLKG